MDVSSTEASMINSAAASASAGAGAGAAGASASASGVSRFETFTEAVPLSLSSMAHTNIPLDAGVLDGVKEVLSHTMLSCVNYARIMYAPHQWTFRDLCTSKCAWTPFGISSTGSSSSTSTGGSGDDAIPFALEKMKFKHQYCRNAYIYLNKGLDNDAVTLDEEKYSMYNWQQTKLGVLGRVSFLYISTEPLTPGELDGTDTEDMPPCILYKVVVEYRSLPPSGKESPVLAEELSMLSFGGSVDDDVKYGALASLYDSHAKYVLEIYSVRGKKYKFDLMDSTLSDGTIPRLPPTMEGHPFAKCLCVTVTNHNIHTRQSSKLNDEENEISMAEGYSKGAVAQNALEGNDGENAKPSKIRKLDQQDEEEEAMDEGNCKSICSDTTKPMSNTTTSNHNGSTSDNNGNNVRNATQLSASENNKYCITRMNLTLEGKLRTREDSINVFDDLPPFDFMNTAIASTFPCLNPKPPLSVNANPSGHALILDPAYAGHVYVNGRYITTWSEDVRVGSSGIALYGMDLHSIPVWQGSIIDYEVLRISYAQLWQELLVDAKVVHMNLSRSLLFRLMKGKEPPHVAVAASLVTANADADADDTMDYDDNGDYDDDDDDAMDEFVDNKNDADTRRSSVALDHGEVNVDCLEAQVLGAATYYDRVGIAAKALATRFAVEFGDDAYPCLAHETSWVKKVLPSRRPVVVPQRLITIVRRGGYFDIQKTQDLLWYENTRPIASQSIKEGEDERSNEKNYNNEMEIIAEAIKMLENADCTYADTTNITIVTVPVTYNVLTSDAVCRYNEETEQFYVHEKFFEQADVQSYLASKTNGIDIDNLKADDEQDVTEASLDPIRVKAFLLGMYIAKAHPYGKILVKYLIRNRP